MHLNSILLPFVVFCPVRVCVCVQCACCVVLSFYCINTVLLHITCTHLCICVHTSHHIDTKHSPIYRWNGKNIYKFEEYGLKLFEWINGHILGFSAYRISSFCYRIEFVLTAAMAIECEDTSWYSLIICISSITTDTLTQTFTIRMMYPLFRFVRVAFPHCTH